MKTIKKKKKPTLRALIKKHQEKEMLKAIKYLMRRIGREQIAGYFNYKKLNDICGLIQDIDPKWRL